MNTTIKREKITTLTLNEDETKWLRSICQNPMWVNDPKDWITLGDQDGKTEHPVSSQGKKTG